MKRFEAETEKGGIESSRVAIAFPTSRELEIFLRLELNCCNEVTARYKLLVEEFPIGGFAWFVVGAFNTELFILYDVCVYSIAKREGRTSFHNLMQFWICGECRAANTN